MTETELFDRPPKTKPTLDDWVGEDMTPSAPLPEATLALEATKRIVIELPASLKTRIDIHCATYGRKQKDVVGKILADAFPPVTGA